MAPDDIRAGGFVTILSRPPQQTTGRASPFDLTPAATIEVADRRDLGVPFFVAAVSIPFVVLEADDGTRRVEDVREIELKPVPEEYAAAWAARKEPKKTGFPRSIVGFYTPTPGFWGGDEGEGDDDV